MPQPLPSRQIPAPDYGYGNRWDESTQSYSGPPKGLGFFGPLQMPNGGTMGELSLDDDINGKNVQFPSIVPTLSQPELQGLLNTPDVIPDSVRQKAKDFATQRLAAGMDPFAQAGEQANTYPDLTRNAISQQKNFWSGMAPALAGLKGVTP